MTTTTPTDTHPSATKPALLFVDDEPNILSALQRLFRPLGYRIFTAPGGAEGLELLEREKVDLIISDMRMPLMDGATFLEQAAQRWPHIVRILLTGYADLSSAVAAVNKGNIYRYLSKPWEDNDIKITVQQALEKKALETRVAEQNAQLLDLNANLERRVAAQTSEIRQVLGQLEITYDELKKSFLTSMRVFANLIELREDALAGHARKVADHARALAHRIGMDDAEVQQVLYAALLHDIGKIGLPDAILKKHPSAMTKEEQALVARHPVTGQAALLALEPLHEASLLIRHHHERFDGQGYPDGLRGEAIPLGARILAVANEYDGLQRGTLVPGKLSQAEARSYLTRNRGLRYDPKVVDAFLAMLDEATHVRVSGAREIPLSTDALKPGMVLARDLLSGQGMLLLPKGRELNPLIIGKIRLYERADQKYTLHVYEQ
ncbi:MAG: response regulator [Gammaproteobacteria bacterium]|nr:response regulator [Gammaproteobacteria bacterium]